jgi:hypothetical protein
VPRRFCLGRLRNCTKVLRTVKLLDDVARFRKMRPSEDASEGETGSSREEGGKRIGRKKRTVF